MCVEAPVRSDINVNLPVGLLDWEHCLIQSSGITLHLPVSQPQTPTDTTRDKRKLFYNQAKLLKWCCCSATADVSFGAAAVEHHRPALGSPLQTSHYSCTNCYLQCTKFSNIGFWKAPPLVNEKLPFFIRCIMITGLPKAFDQLCISETAPVLAWLGFPITHRKSLDFLILMVSLNFWLLMAKG